MFKKNPTSLRLTLRALGYLLSYPDAQLRSVMPQLVDALRSEGALTSERMSEIEAVCQHLAALDPLEVEARYVDNFDRGRQTSLHLFEHVHGDSRDRGPALIDLMQTYEKAGLSMAEVEEMYHVMAIANYEDRFVIPTAHREYAENAFDIRGGCGFSFGNGCSDGATEVSMFGGKKPRTIPIKATV